MSNMPSPVPKNSKKSSAPPSPVQSSKALFGPLSTPLIGAQDSVETMPVISENVLSTPNKSPMKKIQTKSLEPQEQDVEESVSEEVENVEEVEEPKSSFRKLYIGLFAFMISLILITLVYLNKPEFVLESDFGVVYLKPFRTYEPVVSIQKPIECQKASVLNFFNSLCCANISSIDASLGILLLDTNSLITCEQQYSLVNQRFWVNSIFNSSNVYSPETITSVTNAWFNIKQLDNDQVVQLRHDIIDEHILKK